jgi:hypothetical protein
VRGLFRKNSRRKKKGRQIKMVELERCCEEPVKLRTKFNVLKNEIE